MSCLKKDPCPCCGSPDVVIDRKPDYTIRCTTCRMMGPQAMTAMEAIREWNALPRKIRFLRKIPDKTGLWLYRSSSGDISGVLVSEESIKTRREYFGDEVVLGEFAGPVALES